MKYQCLVIDDDITIAETTAEYFNIFDIKLNAVCGFFGYFAVVYGHN